MSQGSKKKVTGKRAKAENASGPMKPSGPEPLASITSRHAQGNISRRARGFSLGELNAGGVPRGLATGWGLQIDIRRRSTLEPNVGVLRKWHGSATAKLGEVKKVETELAKVEKKVEAEAKKEGARVKEEVKKVEKKAAKVVEKPAKARQRKKPARE